MATTMASPQMHAQRERVLSNAATNKVMRGAPELGLRACSKNVRFRVRHVARNLWTQVDVPADGLVQDLLDLSLVACDLLSASAVHTVVSEKPRSDAEKQNREKTGISLTGAHDFAVTQHAKLQEKLDRLRKLVQTELDDNIVRKYRQSLPASFRCPSNVQKRRHSSFVPLSLKRIPTVPICVKSPCSLKGSEYFIGRTTLGQRIQQNDHSAALSHLDYPVRQDQYPSYPTASNNFSPLAMRLHQFFGGRKRAVTLGSPRGDSNREFAAGFQDCCKEVENARAEYAIFWVNGGHWLDEYRTIASYKFDADQDLFELQYRRRYIPIDYFQPNFPLGDNYAEGYLRELPESWNESANPAFMSATASFSKIPAWSPSNIPSCYVGWKKRWCVLRDRQLHCYKKAKDANILSSYDLSGLVAVTTPSLNAANAGSLHAGLMPEDMPRSLVLVLQISNSSSLENNSTSTVSVKSLTFQAETAKEFEHWNRIFKSLIKGSPEPSNCSSPAPASNTLPVVAPAISSSGDTASSVGSVQRSTCSNVSKKLNCHHKSKYKVNPIPPYVPQISPGLGIHLHQLPAPPPLPPRSTCQPQPKMAGTPPTTPETYLSSLSEIPPYAQSNLGNGKESISTVSSTPTVSNSCLRHRLTSRSSSQSSKSHCSSHKPTQSASPSFSATQSVARFARSLAKAANRKSVHLPFRQGFRNDVMAEKADKADGPWSDRSGSIDDNTLIESAVHSFTDDAEVQQNYDLGEDSGKRSFELALPSPTHSSQPDKLATPMEGKGVFRVQEQDEISTMPTSTTRTRHMSFIFEGIVDHDMDSRIRTLMMNEIAWLNEDLGSAIQDERWKM